MLKSRRQARLTNKSKLAVYRGELEGSELFSLDSEENGKSNLNSDGVEKGEDQGELSIPVIFAWEGRG